MADDEMFRPIGDDERRSPGHTGRNAGGWIPLSPVPEDAPAPPVDHPKRGPPVADYEYRNATGALIALARRFDKPSGEKDFLPLTYCEHDRSRGRQCRMKAPVQQRPVYGLDRLAARPDAPVVLREGEKAADAAGRLLAGHVVVTAWGGSKAAGTANWGSLSRREVTIWPDADAPGDGYAQAAARCLKLVTATVRVIRPPAGISEG